jgi:hypothetical protein
MSNQIVTLDGKFWDKDSILKQMENDEFYYEYLGKNALSSSSVKLLNKSPKAYDNSLKFVNKRTGAMTLGWLLHLAVFEIEKFGQLNFVDASTKNTKIYKEAFSDNPMTFLQKEYDETMRLADAIYSNSDAVQLIEGLEYEQPAIGNIMNIPFRAKADALNRGEMIVDLKSTSGLAEGSFPYNARKYGYASQVYIYCNLFGINYKDFVFLCICKDTKDIGIYNVSEDFYLDGEEFVDNAVGVYNKWIAGGLDLHQYTINGTL